MAAGAEAVSTVGAALDAARKRLASSDTPALDAQLLLAHVLSKPRSWVLSHVETALDRDQTSHFDSLLERRARGEPVAYLTGSVEWFGARFLVDRRVLIPRPETELLLERALAIARSRWPDGEGLVAVDVGTGSGALAVELATSLPRARVIAVDVSQDALDIAKLNVQAHNVTDRVELRQGSLLEPVGLDAALGRSGPSRELGPKASPTDVHFSGVVGVEEVPGLIVANLPYLSDEMMGTISVDVTYEPYDALYGGSTGTELYERLLGQVAGRRWEATLVLEIDPRQATRIRELVKVILPGARFEVERDYGGHDRIVVVDADPS